MDFVENDNIQKLEKEAEQRKIHSLWVERYRPLKLEDFIGNDLVKSKAKEYIDSNDIPHMLLHGKAGGGKTTLSYILAKTINCDYMYINASDERGIDDVREKIKGFAISVGFRDLKVIILDEADYLTPQAQAALRSVMETYSQTTRFILTCNNVERVIEPIISRCQVFKLLPPSKKEITMHILNGILRKENVETANPDDLKFVINSMYPDIRRIINTLQQNTVNNVFSINQKEITESDYKLKVLEILADKRIDKKASIKQIRQIVADNSVSDFTDMYKLMLDRVEEFAVGHIAAVIIIIAEMDYKSSFCTIKEANFASTMYQILNEIKT